MIRLFTIITHGKLFLTIQNFEIEKIAATKQQILDLERCNINLAALGNVREQLEKVRPSDDESFAGHISKIHSLHQKKNKF